MPLPLPSAQVDAEQRILRSQHGSIVGPDEYYVGDYYIDGAYYGDIAFSNNPSADWPFSPGWQNTAIGQFWGEQYHCVIVFPDVKIPHGKQIVQAKVRLVAAYAMNPAPITAVDARFYNIRLNKNPVAKIPFLSLEECLGQRLTSEFALWTPIQEAILANEVYYTSDFSNALQELVNQPMWDFMHPVIVNFICTTPDSGITWFYTCDPPYASRVAIIPRLIVSYRH